MGRIKRVHNMIRRRWFDEQRDIINYRRSVKSCGPIFDRKLLNFILAPITV